ncbi:hypothetical protein Dehly_0491 [Dehalogenimonas lykanthroporepellens BL-DC-9]|nr:hypothetical protein Dehly_0491 [Dehalogenimonas lykanthroporepellens BL-DC-9]
MKGIRKQHWGAEFNYSPEMTANWILETPFKAGGGQFNIGHFGTVTVNSAWWWNKDGFDPGFENFRIDNSGTVHRDRMWPTLNYEYLAPSNLGADGKSFSFTRN